MHSYKNLVETKRLFSALLPVALMAGFVGGATAAPADQMAMQQAMKKEMKQDSSASPTITSTYPANNATNVATSSNSSNNVVSGTTVSASFSQAMDTASIISSPAGSLNTFTLKETIGGNVAGTVAMNAAHTVASFTPMASALKRNTSYTATVSNAAKSAAGIAMQSTTTWRFTTSSVATTVQAPVKLGTAGNFVLLSKTGISTVPQSHLTGDIGVSPISHTAITGFSETVDSSNIFATSTQVIGKIYAADYAAPTPTYMTTAIGDMQIAYNDAAGRSLPNFTELGSGQIGGLTLVPGLYKWGTGVSISNNVTLSGGPNDVWIFQIAGNITQAAATKVTLAGGALAKNIFWQPTGSVAIGASAHFEGIILAKTLIAMKTGASANGRMLAQTAVTLDQNTVTQPAP
ncbi:MAG: ice-binding family protein [Pseudomonadota bacterium]